MSDRHIRADGTQGCHVRLPLRWEERVLSPKLSMCGVSVHFSVVCQESGIRPKSSIFRQMQAPIFRAKESSQFRRHANMRDEQTIIGIYRDQMTIEEPVNG